MGKKIPEDIQRLRAEVEIIKGLAIEHGHTWQEKRHEIEFDAVDDNVGVEFEKRLPDGSLLELSLRVHGLQMKDISENSSIYVYATSSTLDFTLQYIAEQHVYRFAGSDKTVFMGGIRVCLTFDQIEGIADIPVELGRRILAEIF